MVAKTILEQLGGRKFIAMTGARNMLDLGNGLSLRLPSTPHFVKGGINAMRITLTPMDEYDIEFMRVWGHTVKTVEKIEGIYCDQLREIFEDRTGLRTSL